MTFTITKVSDKNFNHFDGLKEMNFSNWEIVFNNTENTLILQMRNGAPFPRKEVLATDVIIKNGTGETPETYTTTTLIRARLIELGYNALVTSDPSGATSWGSITGTLSAQTDLQTALNGKVSKSGDTMTGDLEMPFDEGLGLVYKDSSKRFGFEISDIPKIAYEDIDNDIDNKASLQVFAFEVSSNKTNFRGFGGLQDYTDNIGDLDYPQKIYVDSKLPIETPATTGVALTFETDRVYGSIASPETGNITASTTGAKLGVTNIIIHNSGTAPTFDSKFKKLSGSGSYVISVVNYIYCTYITSTEIIYSINQRT